MDWKIGQACRVSVDNGKHVFAGVVDDADPEINAVLVEVPELGTMFLFSAATGGHPIGSGQYGMRLLSATDRSE